MKRITSTLFNSIGSYADSASQLHIYAFENEQEYWDTVAVIDAHEEQDFLSELGYLTTPISCEPISGMRYSSYTMTIIRDFLVVVEAVSLDV